jgi:hypothetical protein
MSKSPFIARSITGIINTALKQFPIVSITGQGKAVKPHWHTWRQTVMFI